MDWIPFTIFWSAVKALANKNAILAFAFQTPQNFTYFEWTFAVEFFSGVYHPQDSRKKLDRESLSEVCKMLGCWNANTRIVFLFANAFVTSIYISYELSVHLCVTALKWQNRWTDGFHTLMLTVYWGDSQHVSGSKQGITFLERKKTSDDFGPCTYVSTMRD